jgi:hypothetical protein
MPGRATGVAGPKILAFVTESPEGVNRKPARDFFRVRAHLRPPPMISVRKKLSPCGEFVVFFRGECAWRRAFSPAFGHSYWVFL